jgi:hypothetical protein
VVTEPIREALEWHEYGSQDERRAKALPALDRLEAELKRLREENENLRKLIRRILIVDTGIMARGGTQPLVVEQLLPTELIVDKGGTRELVWNQGRTL